MKEHHIFWSPIAEATYLDTLSFILQNWTIKEAEEFEKKVESLLTKLKKIIHLCPPSLKHSALRRCVISPQSSLVYQIRPGFIELVAFLDNRSEHRY